MVEDGSGESENDGGDANKDNRPVYVHGIAANTGKVQPHDEAEEESEETGELAVESVTRSLR